MDNNDKLKKLTPEQEMVKNSPLFFEIYKGQEEIFDNLNKLRPFSRITAPKEYTGDVLVEIRDDKEIL